MFQAWSGERGARAGFLKISRGSLNFGPLTETNFDWITNHLLAGIYDKENRLHDSQTALGRREDQPSSVNP